MKFRGHSYRSLDPKGRLMLPPEFRELVLSAAPEGRVVLTNFDGCVVGYPLPEWEQIEDSFAKVNMLDKKMRDFHRFFIASAVEAEVDKQGRVLIPPHLRTYGGLDRELVLAGVGRKFEIWDRERYERRMAETEASFGEVMDSMTQSGIELRL